VEKLSIYEAVRSVPDKAKKTISGGRLNGMTDINPMWRIKTLTEQFGPCGIGWHYTIVKQWLENGPDGDISAFTNIELFIKVEGEWSLGIPGTGGSTFVAKEKNGLKMSDEAFKMSLTDALSVSCKALGIGADVYWEKDTTKYSRQEEEPQRPQAAPSQGANNKANDAQIKKLFATAKGKGVPDTEIKQKLADMGKTSSKELTVNECSNLIDWANEWQEAV